MTRTKNSFYIGIITLWALFYIVQFVLQKQGLGRYISPFYWWIQLFVTLVSLVVHYFTSRGLKKRTDFHLYYMGSMTIRFLGALFFLLGAVLYLSEGQGAFAVNFLVIYFAYTGFEIYYLLTNLRADSEKNGKKNS